MESRVATMTSLNTLREFISERLTAAAGEIFTVFERTVLQYEEQIARQHKLLEVSWNPRVKLIRTDSLHQHAVNQKTSSTVEQEEHEAPLIKREDLNEMTVTEGQTETSHEPLRDVSVQQLTAAADLQQEDEEDEEERLLKQKINLCLEQEGTQPPEIREKEGLLHFKEEREEAELLELKKDQEEPGRFQTEENRDLDTDREFNGNSFTAPSVDHQTDCSETKPVPDSEHSLPRDPHANAHSGEAPSSCDKCGKSFSMEIRRLSHVRLGVCQRSYACETCSRTFSNHSSLMRHTKTHTGEKPYSCKTCGKTFSQHGNMMAHVRTHTGERPYSCERCGRRFSDQSCFSRHVRAHTGERPYSCETCGKGFKRQNHLLVHIRTHTGEKPYSCETCGKKFAHRNSFLHHVKSHKEMKS